MTEFNQDNAFGFSLVSEAELKVAEEQLKARIQQQSITTREFRRKQSQVRKSGYKTKSKWKK